MQICRIDTSARDFEAVFQKKLSAATQLDESVAASVRSIISEVRRRGDEAVLEYAHEFDGSKVQSLRHLKVSTEHLQQARSRIPRPVRDALEQASRRVFRYAEKQKLQEWYFSEENGTVLGQRVSPLGAVGLYVPGGKAVYPSSILMSAIPAKVAGVPRLVMTTPPCRGTDNSLILGTADLCGLDEVWLIGGAQAIAALALGTQTIAAVDKVVGPGNVYVVEAKRQLSAAVGTDAPAGPSEILIICDTTAPPDWVAADLLSQAEHDEMARSILLCPEGQYIEAVIDAMEMAIAQAPRARIIRDSLSAHGLMIEVRDLDEAAEIANWIAPEHLEIFVEDPDSLLTHIHNAGAVFVGKYSSEVIGDYCAGPSHVLPTGGAARFSSPLGVYDFQKRSSFVRCSREGAEELGEIASCLAQAEGLFAHADAALKRTSKKRIAASNG